MKRSAIIFAASLLLTLSACGQDADSSEKASTSAEASSEASSAEDTTAEQSTEASSAETSTEKPPADSTLLKNGAWFGICPDRHVEGVYTFLVVEDDKVLLTDADYNVASLSTYTVSGDKMIFENTLDHQKNEHRFEMQPDGTFLLYDSANDSVTYKWFMDADVDTFTFNPDAALERMAKDYYGLRTNHVPEFADVIDDDIPRTVMIHLYDIIDGHASTSTWYYIDRFTGKGEDVVQTPVDLNDISADIWSPELSIRGEMKKDGQFCAVGYVGPVDSKENSLAENREYFISKLANSGFMDMFIPLGNIPDQNFCGTQLGTELYLVIPADKDATIEVIWYDFVNDRDLGTIYRSYNGAPILLKCNYSDISSDVRIRITDKTGTHEDFAPYISLKDGSVQTGNDHVKLIESKWDK